MQAKADKRPLSVAAVAGKLYDLGEKEKARALVAEYLGAGKVAPDQRVLFGYDLARVDPAAALGIARELAASNRQDANADSVERGHRPGGEQPRRGRSVLRLVPQEEGQSWMLLALAWKLARSEPTRARRLVDESQRYDDSPQTYLYLACGLKGLDPAAAEAAFWKGIEGIDRLLETGAEHFAMKVRGGPAAPCPWWNRSTRPLFPRFSGAPWLRGLLSTVRARWTTARSVNWPNSWSGTTARLPRLPLRPIVS